jgi:chaperone modulatory protein CbpM
MTTQGISVSVGCIVEDENPLSIEDLCRLCAVERQFILELVEEGVLEAQASTQLHFVGPSLRRARLAGRLHRDLGVNVAGAALVIELLERIEVLEQGRRGSPPGG